MRWIPTLYFVQGLQFFVVNRIAAFMLKNLGLDNALITQWLGLIGAAWVVKPLWSPFLEMVRSKKLIVVATQFISAGALALMAVVLQLPVWFAAAIAVLFILAYASATHDIACDGLYMAALDDRQQARFAGWQGAFFNASKFLILGGLLVLAGRLEQRVGVGNAWSLIFALLAVLLALLAAYNAHALPSAANAAPVAVSMVATWRTLRDVVVDFVRKPGIGPALLFILLFRLAEGQTQTIGPLFLIEAQARGGLGLTTEQVGGVYGTVGTLAFLVGSILGGYFTGWLGLRRALPALIVAMTVPSAVFYYLSVALPQDLLRIGAAVALENFAWGFGFVGVILFIMQVVAPGRFQTAHYALGSGVMQLGLSLPTSFSGVLQTRIGYQDFFLWTVLCGLPALVLWWWLPMTRRPAGVATA
ncbi:MFS transporter [Roseateles cellulosilyticus]|uniref:MFS transporter n=1 Tax=Pelomonas cellulosilytica TaxID=2906762 RepID=A0ABS8Y345_9BURK|nr:MFS transporter [Pelomonas sp. P8]MCE4558198.1 MFS transporter [Pelomonas sp. P8]